MKEIKLEYRGRSLRGQAQLLRGKVWVHVDGETFSWEPKTHTPAEDFSDGGSGEIRAPMPGKVIKINFGEGEEVKKGDVLIVMEAMKMEYTLASPADGRVTKLACEPDQQVEQKQVLAEVGE